MTGDLTLWRWLGALILVLALMGGLVVLLQTFGPSVIRRRKGGQGELAVRDSMALDPRRRLLVVSWRKKDYLLLLSPQGEQLLAQQDSTPPTPVKKVKK